MGMPTVPLTASPVDPSGRTTAVNDSLGVARPPNYVPPEVGADPYKADPRLIQSMNQNLENMLAGFVPMTGLVDEDKQFLETLRHQPPEQRAYSWILYQQHRQATNGRSTGPGGGAQF